MANRHAAYKVRTLSREPRTLYAKITVTGDYVGAQTLTNSGPFNDGVVDIVGDSNGLTKIRLGSSTVKRDSYVHLAGVEMISSAADRKLGQVTNSSVNHATDPNLAFKIVDTDDANAVFTNADTVWFKIHLLDSRD